MDTIYITYVMYTYCNWRLDADFGPLVDVLSLLMFFSTYSKYHLSEVCSVMHIQTLHILSVRKLLHA